MTVSLQEEPQRVFWPASFSKRVVAMDQEAILQQTLDLPVFWSWCSGSGCLQGSPPWLIPQRLLTWQSLPQVHLSRSCIWLPHTVLCSSSDWPLLLMLWLRLCCISSCSPFPFLSVAHFAFQMNSGSRCQIHAVRPLCCFVLFWQQTCLLYRCPHSTVMLLEFTQELGDLRVHWIVGCVTSCYSLGLSLFFFPTSPP